MKLSYDEFKRINGLPDDLRQFEYDNLSPDEQKEYNRYLDSEKFIKAMGEKREKPKDMKKVLIWVLIWVVEIGILFYSQNKKINDHCISIFKENACLHGIQVDGQWFRTADELTNYIKKHYTEFKFYVVYCEYNINEFQYFYHPSGL